MSDVVDLFGEPAPAPAPTPATEPVIEFTDLDRLRLNLNGARYDQLVDQIKVCRRCAWSWPLLCELHTDHVLYSDVDEYEGY